MALLCKQRFMMKPIRDKQICPQQLHVMVCSMLVSEGSQIFHLFFLSSILALHVVSKEVMACVSPVHATGCLCCPLMVIDATSGEGPFQSVFVSCPRCPYVTTASGEYSIMHDLWQAMVSSSGDKPGPVDLW